MYELYLAQILIESQIANVIAEGFKTSLRLADELARFHVFTSSETYLAVNIT